MPARIYPPAKDGYKTCSKCHTSKQVEQFARNITSIDKLNCWCRPCLKEGLKIANKKYELTQAGITANKRKAKKWRSKRRFYVDYIKRKYGCIYCSENEPCALDFHHKKPEEKNFTISQYRASATLRDFVAEIKKCIVICSNCHRKVHAGILPIPT